MRSPGRAQAGQDPSARDWARTRTSDATAPPPPASQAAVEARTDGDASSSASSSSSSSAGTPDTRPGGADGGPQDAAAVPPAAPRRQPLLVQGLVAAAVAGVLAVAVAAGTAPLVGAAVVLQLLLVRSLLRLLDAPAAGGALVVAGGIALAADVVVVVDDGRVDRLAAVLGLGFVVALLAQLSRRRRHRVTESIADTLVAAVVGSSAACLVALHQLGGGEVLLVALASVAAALLVGRAADRVLPRPALAVGASRGWPGLLLGLAAAVGAALWVAGAGLVGLEPGPAGLLALAVSATAVAADLAVDLGAAELRAGRRDARRAASLLPVSALLPYALVGSVALLAGRLVPT